MPGTIYPSGIDSFAQLPSVVDLVSPIRANDVNRLRDAIFEIEKELGINPSDTFSTVRDRIDYLDLLLTGGVGGVPAELVVVTDADGYYVNSDVENILAEIGHELENISASEVSILDTDGYYASSNIEDALAEIGHELENISASEVSILDADGYYVNSNVEDALAEIGHELENISASEVSILDTDGYYVNSDVENVLAEIGHELENISASEVSILDTDGYYVNSNVEDALAEIGAELSDIGSNNGFLNFRDEPYNAVADGYTDNRDALQSIVTDAREQGKAVYIPSGTYAIWHPFGGSSSVYIGDLIPGSDSVRIFGDGREESVLRWADHLGNYENTTQSLQPFYVDENNSIVLEKLKITSPTWLSASNLGQIVLTIGEYTNVEIDNCILDGCGHNVKISDGYSNFTARDTEFLNSVQGYAIQMVHTNQPGESTSYFEAYNCVFSLHPNALANTHCLYMNKGVNIRLDNCDFIRTATNGQGIQTFSGTGVSKYAILNNCHFYPEVSMPFSTWSDQVEWFVNNCVFEDHTEGVQIGGGPVHFNNCVWKDGGYLTSDVCFGWSDHTTPVYFDNCRFERDTVIATFYKFVDSTESGITSFNNCYFQNETSAVWRFENQTEDTVVTVRDSYIYMNGSAHTSNIRGGTWKWLNNKFVSGNRYLRFNPTTIPINLHFENNDFTNATTGIQFVSNGTDIFNISGSNNKGLTTVVISVHAKTNYTVRGGFDSNAGYMGTAASASTLELGASDGNLLNVTGTTTIDTFGLGPDNGELLLAGPIHIKALGAFAFSSSMNLRPLAPDVPQTIGSISTWIRDGYDDTWYQLGNDLASGISIIDTDGYYVNSDVENVLAEIGHELENISASEVSILDADGYYAGSNVEDALAEIYAQVNSQIPHSNIISIMSTTNLSPSSTTVLANASSGEITVNLSGAAAAESFEVTIKKTDSSSNDVVVSSGDLIDGSSTQLLVSQYDSITVFSDGSTYWIV